VRKFGVFTAMSLSFGGGFILGAGVTAIAAVSAATALYTLLNDGPRKFEPYRHASAKPMTKEEEDLLIKKYTTVVPEDVVEENE
jgi:hypothetical protein